MTRSRLLATMGDFPNVSESVKDGFISACGSMKLRQKLLREKELTLEKCIEMARNSEMEKI